MTETDDIVARLHDMAEFLGHTFVVDPDKLARFRRWEATAHITRLEERCAALAGQVEAGAAEIERQRELFRLDGEGHASYVRDLTNKHEVRITKYAERIGEMMCERDAARREIRQLEEFIGRREDDILHIARENASLKEEVERLREALHDIAEHPEKSSCRTGSYAVGWAFFNVQGIARTALKNQEPKP